MPRLCWSDLVPHSQVLAHEASLILLVSRTALIFLALLGWGGCACRGASVAMGAVCVTFWGALAMGLTAGVGALF